MKFEATFSEHGRVMTRTYDKPDANVHYVHELQQLLRLGGYAELANNVKI